MAGTQERGATGLGWTDVLFGILFEPQATLRNLSEEKPLFWGVITFLAVSIFNLTIYRGILLQQYTALGNMQLFLWWYQIIAALFSFFMLFVMAGLFSLLSELLFRKTNASGLLVCLCFAALPGIFAPALHYSAILIHVQWLGILCSVLIGIWMVVLQVLSLRESLQITTGQAVALFFVPGLVIFIITALVLVIIVASGMAIK